MKRTLAILFVIIAAMSLFAGCGRTVEPEEAVETVEDELVVDAERDYYGGINIYVEGKGFDYWGGGVVDYVEGDPAGISPEPVHGIFAVLNDGESEPTNVAIKKNGEVERIDSSFKLLPRAAVGESFVFYETKEGQSMTLTLQPDNTYTLLIKGKGGILEHGVEDAWVAYDTVYWLQNGNVYSLDWQSNGLVPELYFEGANAVSHGSDESEGALVPLDQANYSAYGRDDIYSPYGYSRDQ